jgi:hypothetical protein
MHLRRCRNHVQNLAVGFGVVRGLKTLNPKRKRVNRRARDRVYSCTCSPISREAVSSLNLARGSSLPPFPDYLRWESLPRTSTSLLHKDPRNEPTFLCSSIRNFTPLVPAEAMKPGPPFPEKFEYGIVPPRYRTIAYNRPVPFYRLGWMLTEHEFLRLYDPTNSFDEP